MCLLEVYQKWWQIGTDGGRDSKDSAVSARLNNDDDDDDDDENWENINL